MPNKVPQIDWAVNTVASVKLEARQRQIHLAFKYVSNSVPTLGKKTFLGRVIKVVR